MDGAKILGYTGALRDAVTRGYPLGNGYRTYLPGFLRFSAPDEYSPFGAGGLNPYVYCADDPINSVDPTGHSALFDNLPDLDLDAALEGLGMNASNNPRHQLSGVDLLAEGSNSPSTQHPSMNAASPHGRARPSTSGTSLAAANANAGGTTVVPPELSNWLDAALAPRPVYINRIPTSDDGLTYLFNDAYYANQITINPDGAARSKALFKWQPDIVLDGTPLHRNDATIVALMKRYGVTRGESGAYADKPYMAQLPYEADTSVSTQVALGALSTQITYFTPIILPDTDFTMRYTAKVYTRAFGKQSAEFGKPVQAVGRAYRLIS